MHRDGVRGCLFRFQSIPYYHPNDQTTIKADRRDQWVVLRWLIWVILFRRLKRNSSVRRGYQTGSITMQLSWFVFHIYNKLIVKNLSLFYIKTMLNILLTRLRFTLGSRGGPFKTGAAGIIVLSDRCELSIINFKTRPVLMTDSVLYFHKIGNCHGTR